MAVRESPNPVIELVCRAQESGMLRKRGWSANRLAARGLARKVRVSQEAAERVYAETGPLEWSVRLRKVASDEAAWWYAHPESRLAGYDVVAIDQLFHQPSRTMPPRVVFVRPEFRVPLPAMDVPESNHRARALFFVCVRMYRYQLEIDA